MRHHKDERIMPPLHRRSESTRPFDDAEARKSLLRKIFLTAASPKNAYSETIALRWNNVLSIAAPLSDSAPYKTAVIEKAFDSDLNQTALVNETPEEVMALFSGTPTALMKEKWKNAVSNIYNQQNTSYRNSIEQKFEQQQKILHDKFVKLKEDLNASIQLHRKEIAVIEQKHAERNSVKKWVAVNILSTKKDEDHEKAIIEKKINDIIAALNKEQQASEQQAENLMLELVNELAKLDEDLAANTTEDKLASEVSKVEKAFGFLIRQHKLDTEQPTDDTERQQELVRPMSRSIPLSTPANTLENTPVKDEKKPEPPEIDHQWLMAILGIQREEESLKRKREKEREPPQRGRSPSLSR